MSAFFPARLSAISIHAAYSRATAISPVIFGFTQLNHVNSIFKKRDGVWRRSYSASDMKGFKKSVEVRWQKQTRLEGEGGKKHKDRDIDNLKVHKHKEITLSNTGNSSCFVFYDRCFHLNNPVSSQLLYVLWTAVLHSSPRQRRQSKTKGRKGPSLRNASRSRCVQMLQQQWCSLTYDSLAGWWWRLEADSHNAWSRQACLQREQMFSVTARRAARFSHFNTSRQQQRQFKVKRKFHFLHDCNSSSLIFVQRQVDGDHGGWETARSRRKSVFMLLSSSVQIKNLHCNIFYLPLLAVRIITQIYFAC